MTRLAIWASGPFLASCGLLGWSGVVKLSRPATARAAAHAAGLPSSPTAVRAFAATEVVVAVAGAVVGYAAALPVAVMYAFLAGVASRLYRRAPATPCGCLGGHDAPVSRAHVVVNMVFAGVTLVAVFAGSPLARITTLPLAGVPFVVLVVCAARLAALTIDTPPPLTAQPGRQGER